MSTESKFARRGPAAANPVAGEASTPAGATTAAANGGDLNETFSALQARATSLRDRRQRLTFQQEQVQREIESCESEARELGVSSLEELQALVQRMETEEQERMRAYDEALTQEDARLSQVEGDLARLDTRGNGA